MLFFSFKIMPLGSLSNKRTKAGLDLNLQIILIKMAKRSLDKVTNHIKISN